MTGLFVGKFLFREKSVGVNKYEKIIVYNWEKSVEILDSVYTVL